MGCLATVALGALLFQAAPDAATDKLALELDRTVQRTTKGGFWGAILVARNGKVILAKGYGFADYARRPNTPTTLFELASTSKQVAATAILRLAQDKKLTLDDPLSKFFKGVPSDKKTITVRHLLHHTSGIDNAGVLPYASPATRKQFAAAFLRQRVLSAPGAKFAYSNPGYALLAAIVEEVTGKSFEVYCHEQLFKPAGLKDTGFIKEPKLDRSRDTVRLDDRPGMGGTACDWHYGWGYRGMGGVVSTAEDLLRWDRALRGDAILDAAHRKILYTPALAGYACGWRVSTTPRGTRKAQHSGGVAGYVIQLARYLEDDVVIVVLSNGGTNVHAIEQALSAVLFRPPQIEVLIRHAGLQFNKWQAAIFGTGGAWKASKRGDKIVVALHVPKRKAAVAEITLPKDLARGLAASLVNACTGKRPGGRNMDAGVYLNGYMLGASPFQITKNLTLTVMPQYRGDGEDGQPILDIRPTLVLKDTRSGQWPVMVKMDVGVAQGLAKRLRALAR